MKRVALAYIPVLHQGYLNFLSELGSETELWLIDRELAHSFRPLEKDVRALEPELVQKLLSVTGLVSAVRVVSKKELKALNESATVEELIIPDEEQLEQLAAEYVPSKKLTKHSVFLRWDSTKSTACNEVSSAFTITKDEFDQKMMELAHAQSKKSTDWWRQLGCVVVKDDQVLLQTHNHHVPDPQEPYFNGDPRADFKKGEHIELSTALHAEAAAIAEAARLGISLEGATMYVETFPCPVCAKSIAYSGVERVVFRDGYSMLDGASILESRGVRIERVE